MRTPLLAAVLVVSSMARAQEPVPLVEQAQGPLPLAGHIAELHDPAGQWTLQDVQRSELAGEFVTVPRATVNHGLSDQVYWYRLALRAQQDALANEIWLLTVGIPTLDYVDIHVTRADGGTETTLTGDLRPAPPNLVPSSPFVIPVRMQPGEQVVVHVRVQMTGRHQVLLEVQSPRVHADQEGYWDRRNGAVYGIMAAMAIYNLLIFFVIRDRAYVHYVLFITSMLLVTLVLTGDVRQWAQAAAPGALPLVNVLAPITATLTGLFSTTFGREFMQTAVHAPRVHRLTTALVVLAAGPLIVLPVFGFLAATKVLGVVFLGNFGMLAVAVYLSWKGVRAARFYLVCWVVLVTAFTANVTTSLGLVPANLVLLGAPPLAMCVVVTLLSLALADRLNVERRERERLGRLKRFFAPEVATSILEGGEDALLAPKRREITVLFTDLRGFTAFSAESEPEDLIRVLREYREAIVGAAAKHGGTLEHFSGDGVMVYFNAPMEIADPEASAVRMAFQLRQQLTAICEGWRKRTHELGFGMGMASGFATVGAVGFEGRMDYSVIGSVTNLAARLCAQAEHGQVLVSKKLLLKIESLVAAEHLGERELKGLPKPVTVYNLTGLAPA